MGFLDRLQARTSLFAYKAVEYADTVPSGMELKRIEQRYVERRNRRAYLTNAVYVNGEYVYPTSTARPVEAFKPMSPSSAKSGWSWSSKANRRG